MIKTPGQLKARKVEAPADKDKVPTAEFKWVVWLAERVIDEVHVLTIQVEEHP